MTDDTTILCDCPRCGRICGFKTLYAGRTARCLNCNTRFIIPKQSGRPAIPCPPPRAAPLPGFYKNALIGGLKAFTRPDSITGLVFCTAMVVAHFLLGNMDLSFTIFGFRPPLVIGWVVTFIAFGCFAWYCMEIIINARLGLESMPPVETGSGFDFIWLVIKSCYLFLITLVIALLPASFISAWFESFDWPLGIVFPVLVAGCLFLWPINLAMIAMEVPFWRIFRYDLIFAAVAKTFWPYLFTALITLAAFILIWLGIGFFATSEDMTLNTVAGLLALRLAGAAMFLLAMRTIGVYGLHYADLCPDLWLTPPPQAPDEV